MTDCQKTRSISERTAGLVLLATSTASVLGMANHPTSFAEYTALSRMLHGMLVVVAVLAFAAFVEFARKRGLARFSVLLGLVFLAFGTIANALAGSINGFVVPELMDNATADEAVLALCWALNQTMAQGAVYASGAAFLIWGADMAVTNSGSVRIAGVAGALSGLVPVMLLATSLMDMSVGGAVVAYSIQAAFGLVAAWVLVRN